HPTDQKIISKVALIDFNYDDVDGSGQTLTNPTVTATTSVDVTLPARVTFMGYNFPSQEKLTFKRTYKYPIIKLKLQQT
ncbi:MAG: hypothetical protein HY711_03810, partial [Candidatus Melainabacteria bacterium]|nr:hypothetical protein [Candidatus Melainabacteria bacterium]